MFSGFFTTESSQPPELEVRDQEMPSVGYCGRFDVVPDDHSSSSSTPTLPSDEDSESFSQFFTDDSANTPQILNTGKEIASVDICGGILDERHSTSSSTPTLPNNKDSAKTPEVNITEEETTSLDTCGWMDSHMTQDNHEYLIPPQQSNQENFPELFSTETSETPTVNGQDHTPSVDTCGGFEGGLPLRKSRTIRDGLVELQNVDRRGFFTTESSQPPNMDAPNAGIPSVDICGRTNFQEPDISSLNIVESAYETQERSEFFTEESSQPPVLDSEMAETQSFDVCGGRDFQEPDTQWLNITQNTNEIPEQTEFFTEESAQPPVLNKHSDETSSIDVCGGRDM